MEKDFISDAGRLQTLKTLLIGKRLKIAVAESITCGRLQAALGAISGSSAFFEGGLTAYNLRQKTSLLGIDAQHAKNVNCVSQRVAFELAEGVIGMFQCDIGIGTTGYAEAAPDTIPEPFAYIGICRRIEGEIRKIAGEQVKGAGLTRLEMQHFTAESALSALIRYLEGAGA